MEQSFEESFQSSRFLSRRLLYDWLKKENIFDFLQRPENIPSIFYQRRWPESSQEVFERIFQFLVSEKILQDAGGTYFLSDYYPEKIKQIEEFDLNGYSNNPIYKFVKYGLNILSLLLEGDSGRWDVERFGFLFERGINQTARLKLNSHLYEQIKRDTNSRMDDNVDIVLMCLYPDGYLDALSQLQPNKESISIVVPNEEYKLLAITYCEMIHDLIQYSGRIFTFDEFRLMRSGPSDLILIPNGIGFHLTFQEMLTYISSYSKLDTLVYGIAETEANYEFGIESFYFMHPQFTGIPTTDDFERQFRAKGYTNPIRIGPNNLIFSCKYNRV